MKRAIPFLIIGILLCLRPPILSQVKMSAKEFNKMSKVDFLIDEDRVIYAGSSLFSVTDNSVTILREITKNPYTPPVYAKQEVQLDGIDYIILTSRKRRIKNSLIGGVALGTASFLLTRKFVNKDVKSPTLELLGQPPEKGFFEPIVAGSIGLGLGILIGELSSRTKLKVKHRRNAAIRQLRAFSYQ